MLDQKLPVQFTEKAILTIPSFGSRLPIELNITIIRNAESRLVEAKVVNGATYSELEYTFNEGYREARKHLSIIWYEITQAKKAFREAKSEALLDQYKDFLKDKELKDSAAIRDAFLEKNEAYTGAQDRIDMLSAMEGLFESKVKVFENACRYMKKEIDILIRSGCISNKYGSGG